MRGRARAGALGRAHAVARPRTRSYNAHKGKRVLFPFAFHCTGMPIQAAANKLARELDEFGMPPRFPEDEPAPGERVAPP